MKKIYIVESFKAEDTLFLHSLEGEEFNNFVNKNAHVSIVTLTEEAEPQECAAVASVHLAQDEAIMIGIKAMVTHTKIGSNLIEILESKKEFAN